jgi:hypothetical protein
MWNVVKLLWFEKLKTKSKYSVLYNIIAYS